MERDSCVKCERNHKWQMKGHLYRSMTTPTPTLKPWGNPQLRLNSDDQTL